MNADAEVLAAVDAAFGAVRKPDHFTDYQHCEECAEHDETLRSHDRDTLRVEHVDNPGWDPLCFCSAEGKAYYMPTLARFALAPTAHEYDWYGPQLLFHLAGGGASNSFYEHCDAAQRLAVAGLLAHFVLARPVQVDESMSTDELLRTHELWSAAA
jgi:hypothetical protein